jgi:hypothetical protein
MRSTKHHACSHTIAAVFRERTAAATPITIPCQKIHSKPGIPKSLRPDNVLALLEHGHCKLYSMPKLHQQQQQQLIQSTAQNYFTAGQLPKTPKVRPYPPRSHSCHRMHFHRSHENIDAQHKETHSTTQKKPNFLGQPLPPRPALTDVAIYKTQVWKS